MSGSFGGSEAAAPFRLRRRFWKRPRFWLACLLSLTAPRPVFPGDPSEPVTEYQLKAAFLLNFAKFVEWPEGPARQGPIQICVAGKDPFGDLLVDVLRGQSAQGRALAVARPKGPEDFRQCGVLFIAASEKKRQAILQAVRGAPVLTVGETPGFAESGGMVNLVLESKRIRLESNPDEAAQAGLRISSRLLQLTRVVKTAAGGQ
jgi:hypothetical protein